MTSSDPLAVHRARAQAAWDHAANNPPPYITPAEIAAGERGERIAEDHAYELARLEDREEMSTW